MGRNGLVCMQMRSRFVRPAVPKFTLYRRIDHAGPTLISLLVLVLLLLNACASIYLKRTRRRKVNIELDPSSLSVCACKLHIELCTTYFATGSLYLINVRALKNASAFFTTDFMSQLEFYDQSVRFEKGGELVINAGIKCEMDALCEEFCD
jgi:hypothetical protein